MPNRCLYIVTIEQFLRENPLAVLGSLHNNYHGDALTTTDEAWMAEINILQNVLQPWKGETAQIIFEYEIPRLGKRIDAVLLLWICCRLLTKLSIRLGRIQILLIKCFSCMTKTVVSLRHSGTVIH